MTINNIVVNGEIRPYELFINSKALNNVQWIVALTRLISSVLRREAGHKECHSEFLVEELLSTYDPAGGIFFTKDFKDNQYEYMTNSFVAWIGYCLRHHFRKIGLINNPELEVNEEIVSNGGESICPNCNVKAYVKLDGCWTCMSCAYSKCG